MLRTRVIPTLLFKGAGLVKTTGFRDPKYVGDPVNAIKIFNDKEVDELVLLDIAVSRSGRDPAFAMIENIASECFMPVAYGGGIRNVDHMRRILESGVEKVVLNSAALRTPELVTQGAREFGSQAIVVSIDAKRKLLGGHTVMANGGSSNTGRDPATFAQHMEDAGAGEILLTSVDRDGTMKGYDIELITKVSARVRVPVIASGGAGSVEDFGHAAAAGATAVAAGAMFVFKGPHRAVLITYPRREALASVLD